MPKLVIEKYTIEISCLDKGINIIQTEQIKGSNVHNPFGLNGVMVSWLPKARNPRFNLILVGRFLVLFRSTFITYLGDVVKDWQSQLLPCNVCIWSAWGMSASNEY